jgi:hypothetical protein
VYQRRKTDPLIIIITSNEEMKVKTEIKVFTHISISILGVIKVLVGLKYTEILDRVEVGVIWIVQLRYIFSDTPFNQ